MSHDRKPGKVRVVGTAPPARRADDRTAIAVQPPAGAGTTPSPPARRTGLLLAALFVAGCAVGGAGATALGLV